jgi:drug/metabolite transporter (DMT)-like permease
LIVPTLLLARRELVALRRPDLVALALSGTFLALHFGLWTLSLEFTSVASSVVFVTTHPVFVALLEWLWLSQRPTSQAWAGIGLAVLGSVVIAAHDIQLGGEALWGDLLAIGGAIVFVGYLLIGRRLRQRMSLLTYTTPVYAVCWVGLLIWATAAGENVASFPPTDLIWFVLLAVFATLGGHSMFNWALKHVPATLVAVVLVGEPVGAAILAWFFLGEPLTALVVLGGVLILVGIYLTARAS